MTFQLTISWWGFALLWFGVALIIVIVRNLLDHDKGPCNFAPLIIDLPILLIGVFGALGIVVGHFL